MIVDGKKIADEIVAGLGSSLRGLTLGIVVGEGNAATDSFVRVKERLAQKLGVEVRRFGPEQIEEALRCDAVVVQLPMPNADELLAQVPQNKDIDNYPQAPVAAAVEEILRRSNVDPKNKKAVVVGEGRLVGRPVAEMLRAEGALVQVVTLEQGSLKSLKEADIVVSGAGSPNLIKPEMLKQGVVLIDAGTSDLPAGKAGQSGKLAGDCDPACAEVASLFTPVPGGVGPIAVAMLFKNLFTLARRG